MHLTESIIQTALDLNSQEKMLIIGSLMNSMKNESGKSRQEKYERQIYDYEVGIVKSKNFKEVL